ncbi:MAG: ferredoxin [Pseudonocardiaceae bacterium]
MRVAVDFSKCQSHAVCMAVASTVFEVRDDNYLYILDEHPAENLRPQVELAVRSCPTGAIALEEE